ncbi:MAG TPA: hypothetical protein PLA81_11235 [Syntrophorhabdaceae bacterium]|jgi:hypothetical protein|nr:hypothetical protein [Pseudomonadota bacterium]OQC48889.1 MAG: hypothetical protein BWX58_00926 [Deltaproteobacteria bacterium ADurb.Bin026]HOF58845.1 hypothetical protein [Syntrophorhabdaceae bacterium]HPL42144.1 hypothetical protein [Syntrophorhabdaceae bacterium]
MRATLNIPDYLIFKVQSFSGEKFKTKAIIAAMQDYIADAVVSLFATKQVYVADIIMAELLHLSFIFCINSLSVITEFLSIQIRYQ